MTTQSAKTPWKYINQHIEDNSGYTIAMINNKNNAAHIVHCVNHFDEMREALGYCIAAVETGNEEDREYAARQARAILERVKSL